MRPEQNRRSSLDAASESYSDSNGIGAGPVSSEVSRKMKDCEYCGRENDEAATRCCECGSSAFAAGREPAKASRQQQLDRDEIAPDAMARKDGGAIRLKCRTPEEAYLVCEELEEADILTILPDQQELELQYQRNGYVEVRVSARAYESLADLRSVVEFQHRRVRSEQPLPTFGKLVGIGSAVMIVPGALVFAWLLSSYRKDGYDQMAKELKLWFFLGVAAWLLMLCALFAFCFTAMG